MIWFDLAWDLQHILNPWWWQINIALLIILVLVGYSGIKRPALAVGATIILLPTYLFRSRLAFLPFTYLELLIWVTCVSWLVNHILSSPRRLGSSHYKEQIPDQVRNDNTRGIFKNLGFKKYRWPIPVLLAAATIGMFIAPNFMKAAGLWRAYFIEPMMFFVVAYNVARNEDGRRLILWSLGISTLSISLLAIFQKFTGIGIYEPSWMAPDHRRVTAIFSSPNAVGLFLGPIIAIYTGWLMAELKNKAAALLKLIVIALALMAIWFTESIGTLLGLTVALAFMGFFGWSKKWTAAIVLGALILCLAVPLTRHRVIETVLLRDTSGQNRVFLWSTALGHLTQNPKNFLLGTGILGFAELQDSVRNPLKMEPLLYPHNIILNFWLEIGLLGVIGMAWLITIFFLYGFRALPASSYSPRLRSGEAGKLPASHWLTLGIMAAMVTVIIHGLIDVPYFKNDLAVLFWILVALL